MGEKVDTFFGICSRERERRSKTTSQSDGALSVRGSHMDFVKAASEMDEAPRISYTATDSLKC